jgi:hypothetical protein
MLMVVLMAGALGFFALKVVPVYIENWTLKSMMKELESDTDLAGASANKIRQVVLKRIRVNGVYTLKPKNLSIKRVKGQRQVALNYTVSKPLAGNMQIVMEFSEIANIKLSR